MADEGRRFVNSRVVVARGSAVDHGRMRETPPAELTMLFTDIEGSTRLLNRLGPGYADVLAAHRRILRAAFVSAGGRELSTEGDSFFVVFGSAADAVAAAAEGQLGLEAAPVAG